MAAPFVGAAATDDANAPLPGSLVPYRVAVGEALHLAYAMPDMEYVNFLPPGGRFPPDAKAIFTDGRRWLFITNRDGTGWLRVG